MKLLIVDDHPVLREGFAALLAQVETNTLVLQAGDAAQALSSVAEHQDLDLVVLDLLLPGTGGLATITELGKMRPDLPIIVLSSSEDPRDARAALAHGAMGYVPKSANQQVILAAIRIVLNGDIYVPPLILAETINSYPTRHRHHASDPQAALTPRQLDVLRKLSAGHSNGRIALDLGLSEKTVKAHVTSIFRAFDVVSRTQAIAVARQIGLI